MTKINGAEGGIDIELDEQIAQGQYANLAIISHSPTEFVMDFATVLPGMPKAKVVSRLILTPEHAKRLLYSLQENIARYETNHGPIAIHQREGGMPSTMAPVGEA
ncbi:MAG: DUF3467 domain-containing protein [Rikenellaceae bacterium]